MFETPILISSLLLLFGETQLEYFKVERNN